MVLRVLLSAVLTGLLVNLHNKEQTFLPEVIIFLFLFKKKTFKKTNVSWNHEI